MIIAITPQHLEVLRSGINGVGDKEYKEFLELQFKSIERDYKILLTRVTALKRLIDTKREIS